jgi:hypothetical protein
MSLYDQSAQNGVPRGVPQNGSSVEEVKTNAMSRPIGDFTEKETKTEPRGMEECIRWRVR